MSKPSSPLAGATSVVCIGAGGSATALLLAIGLDVNGTLTSERYCRTTRPGASPSSDAARFPWTRSTACAPGPASRPSQSAWSGRLGACRRRDRFRRSRRVPVINDDRPGQDRTRLTATRTGCLPAGRSRLDFNYRGPLTFLSTGSGGQPARRGRLAVLRGRLVSGSRCRPPHRVHQALLAEADGGT